MTIQAHANAVKALLVAPAVPATTGVYDGAVPSGPAAQYIVVDFYLITPDGTQAADAVSLTFDSDVVDLWIYAHCVGGNAIAARAITGQVRAALLNVTPAVTGRSCFPIRHRESAPPVRDEQTGVLSNELTDVYSFRSVPVS